MVYKKVHQPAFLSLYDSVVMCRSLDLAGVKAFFNAFIELFTLYCILYILIIGRYFLLLFWRFIELLYRTSLWPGILRTWRRFESEVPLLRILNLWRFDRWMLDQSRSLPLFYRLNSWCQFPYGFWWPQLKSYGASDPQAVVANFRMVIDDSSPQAVVANFLRVVDDSSLKLSMPNSPWVLRTPAQQLPALWPNRIYSYFCRVIADPCSSIAGNPTLQGRCRFPHGYWWPPTLQLRVHRPRSWCLSYTIIEDPNLMVESLGLRLLLTPILV